MCGVIELLIHQEYFCALNIWTVLFLDKKVEDLYYSLSEKKSKIYIERSVVSTEKFSKSIKGSSH